MTLTSSVFGTYFLRLLGCWGIVHGFFTCVGGIDRWKSHVYDFVRIVPGSPYTWGILLMVAGVLIVWASVAGVDYEIKILNKTINYRRIKNTGLWIMAFETFIFGFGVLLASLYYSDVSLAGCSRDFLICLSCVMMTKAIEPRYVK